MCGRSLRGNREVSGLASGENTTGPHREDEESKPMMHEPEKSDSAVVATKPANKAGRPAAEQVERRAGTEGNVASKARAGHKTGGSVTRTLDRVRQAVTTRCWSPNTLGRSRLREFCTSGSVRGAVSNGRPYREQRRGADLHTPSPAYPVTLVLTSRSLLRPSVKYGKRATVARMSLMGPP